MTKTATFGVPAFKNGSGIHIKEKNRGKFTASAKAAGQSVQEHAKSVLNNPNATPLQKKRANFARNSKKWKHQQGGRLQNSTESGTWGNRGRGNELQSALENSLSKIGDVAVNFGEYIDQGLDYLTGLLPGGQTAQEAVKRGKQRRSSTLTQGGYPILPSFPRKAQSLYELISMKPSKPVTSNIKPKTRLRIGDVEVDNPQLAYRQGSSEMANSFLKSGTVNSEGSGYKNPMFAQGNLWYGIPNEKSLKPQSATINTKLGKFNFTKGKQGDPKTHLLVSTAPMEGANQHSGFNRIRVIKNAPKAITDSEVKQMANEGLLDEAQNYRNMYYSGRLSNEPIITRVGGDPVRRIPAFEGAANKSNTTLYEFIPNYGYKQISSQPNTYTWKHEDGAKIHKPSGHRSILDNGWIPTTRLKKGNYGLIKTRKQ